MGDGNVFDDVFMMGILVFYIVLDNFNVNCQFFFKFDDVNDWIEDYFGYVFSYLFFFQLYFCVLMEFKLGVLMSVKGGFEYVLGYGNVMQVSMVMIGGQKYGVFYLELVKMKDNGLMDYNLMIKMGVLMGCMYMLQFIYDNFNIELVGNGVFQIKDFVSSVVNVIGSFSELVIGLNMCVYNQGKCQRIMVNKLFICFFEFLGIKIGGGVCVKWIWMNDNWFLMDVGVIVGNYEYGQEFSYRILEG